MHGCCRALLTALLRYWRHSPPQDKSHEYTVYMSYVQLYMELIQVGSCGCQQR